MLTNGLSWRVYKVTFAKPISSELVLDIDFERLTPKNAKDIESLYLVCKEGWIKSVLGEYHDQKQSLSRYFIGAMVIADPVVQVLRRELRKLFPDIRVEAEEIKAVLTAEVLKREVLEGEHADEAAKKIARYFNRSQRERAARREADTEPETPVE